MTPTTTAVSAAVSMDVEADVSIRDSEFERLLNDFGALRESFGVADEADKPGLASRYYDKSMEAHAKILDLWNQAQEELSRLRLFR